MSNPNITEPNPDPTTTTKKHHFGRLAAILVAAVVVISIISNAIGGGKTSSTSATTVAPTGNAGSSATTGASATTAAPATTAVPGVGTKVYDGDFAFVVNSLTCGASAAVAVNDGGFGESVPAGAQECLVAMTVTNDKSQAQTFFDSNQYAYDAQKRQFSADTTGAIYLKGDQDATQVNPGVTINAVVPFQIPANDAIVKLELHDSAFSSGVSVAIK